MEMIFLLLVIFQVKHYLADYEWQNEYMLGKFKETGWVLPLATHAGVHALFTLLISLFYLSIQSRGISLIDLGDDKATLSVYVSVLLLTLLDFVVHFTMDRIKASPKMLGKYQMLTKQDFIEHNSKIESYKNAMESDSYFVNNLTLATQKELFMFSKRKKDNKLFWKSLGLDQKVHHLTHYLIIYLMVS